MISRACTGRVFAVAIAPEDPLPGAQLVRLLRERLPQVEVVYPFDAEEAVLHAVFGAPLAGAAASSPGGAPAAALPVDQLQAGTWVSDADLLLVPTITPSLLPTIAKMLVRDLPVIARQSCGAPLPAIASVVLDAEAPLDALLEAAVRVEELPSEREAAQRRGRAQLRRLERRLPAAAPPSRPAAAGSQCSAVAFLVPEEQALAGVSVLVPTRGGTRAGRCLAALRRAAGRVPLQVILIVSGGLNGGIPACDELVSCKAPFVWARANNAGLAAARYPYVLCLNDDCFFQRPGDLQRLVERLELCGHLVAVAPRGTGFAEHWEQSTLPRGAGLRETRFTLCGACFLVRREAFWSVGGFDERFVTYGCDEMDWFYRARAAGYRWAIDADVSVQHVGAATYGEARREAELPHSSRLFAELHGVPDVNGPHWDPPRCAVSWVIASRNNAGHLARCLGSIAAQRHLDPPGQAGMEVVLALDGCADLSAEVAAAFNASLPEPLPLRIVSFPEAAGSPARAKNRALRLARGEIVLPMDDDDATLPGRAQLVAALDAEPAIDVTVGDFRLIHVDGTIEEKESGPVSWERLLRSGTPNWGLWATAIRRRALARYGLMAEDRPSTEDLDFWLRWLRDGARFRHVPVPVHLYLQRPGSTVFSHDVCTAEDEIRRAYRSGQATRRMGLQTASPFRLRGEFQIPPEVRFEAWQRPAELAALLQRFRELQPRRVLEIGTARGGTLREWLDHAPDGAIIVSVDLPGDGNDYREVFQTWVPAGVQLHCLHADSHDPATRDAVAALLPEVDFLFVDGDHRYEGVKQDYEWYGALVRPGGLIALHDIVRSTGQPQVEVSRFWAELRRSLTEAGTLFEELMERADQDGFGIGVVTVAQRVGVE